MLQRFSDDIFLSERILSEYKVYIINLESELFFMSTCSIRIRPKNEISSKNRRTPKTYLNPPKPIPSRLADSFFLPSNVVIFFFWSRSIWRTLISDWQTGKLYLFVRKPTSSIGWYFCLTGFDFFNNLKNFWILIWHFAIVEGWNRLFAIFQPY